MTPLLRNTAHAILPLRLAGAAALAAVSITSVMPAPLAAQDTTAEARLRKVEAEIRALQRKVFPGGDGRFFEPQIGPADPATTTTPANPATTAPSTTAVTDILVRLDALEGQLQRLTARSEEQANAMAQMEQRLAALETANNAPIAVPPPISTGPQAAVAPAPGTPAAGTTAATVRPLTPATSTATPATGVAAPTPTSTPAAAPSAARLAAVQAIAKPQTTDAGDDEYSYGFRLWSAGFFPEARQQLSAFVERYPNHSRISYGRNLLGRAFLDDNMPKEAARWFLQNYQANKAGERAPDSLLYLGKSMIALGDTAKACIALAEFGETYPLVATGRLADDYKASLAKVKCS